MKTLTIALATAILGGIASTADAHGEEHRSRHCRFCIETFRWERQQVRENVCVGYENQIVGYRDEIVGYRDEFVGYENVMVTKTVTEYEMRMVMKRVLVGYDGCGNPIYECRQVCERVPVCRTIQVCEQQPRYEKRPVCEKRPVYERRPAYQERVTCKWVRVPVYICAE